MESVLGKFDLLGSFSLESRFVSCFWGSFFPNDLPTKDLLKITLSVHPIMNDTRNTKAEEGSIAVIKFVMGVITFFFWHS